MDAVATYAEQRTERLRTPSYIMTVDDTLIKIEEAIRTVWAQALRREQIDEDLVECVRGAARRIGKGNEIEGLYEILVY